MFARALVRILARHGRAIIPSERAKKSDACHRRVAKMVRVGIYPNSVILPHHISDLILQAIRTVDTGFELQI